MSAVAAPAQTDRARARDRSSAARRRQRLSDSSSRCPTCTPYRDINITPMLDLAYVLLVTFIILTTAGVAGRRVHMPGASHPQRLQSSARLIVTLNRDGELYLDDRHVSSTDLCTELAAAAAASPRAEVIVKGDAQASYPALSALLAAIQQAGIAHVGLATAGQP